MGKCGSSSSTVRKVLCWTTLKPQLQAAQGVFLSLPPQPLLGEECEHNAQAFVGASQRTLWPIRHQLINSFPMSACGAAALASTFASAPGGAALEHGGPFGGPPTTSPEDRIFGPKPSARLQVPAAALPATEATVLLRRISTRASADWKLSQPLHHFWAIASVFSMSSSMSDGGSPPPWPAKTLTNAVAGTFFESTEGKSKSVSFITKPSRSTTLLSTNTARRASRGAPGPRGARAALRSLGAEALLLKLPAAKSSLAPSVSALHALATGSSAATASHESSSTSGTSTSQESSSTTFMGSSAFPMEAWCLREIAKEAGC
mmetsp:Transcript_3756/g.5855  ORF Transcript_3756/g.5855 Transcript_3756/m.5855 type:complete len:319 (+) Transcript_3756:346-1302(+)